MTLHPTLGSVNTYTPAMGWDTDTTMDVDVTDGSFCTTLTVRDVDVRFRGLKADGYTIFRGHVRGEGVIDTSLPNDGYTFLVEAGGSAFPAITAASGVTPVLSFDFDGSVNGLPTPPPASQWAADDTFRLLVRDGLRPRSRVIRAASFRELPSELTHFAQQIAADPATSPSSIGTYAIAAVDADWLSSPPGTPPVFLQTGDPRPVFSGAGALSDYLDGGARPVSHRNRLLATDGNRPWSAGTLLTFELRYLADDTAAWVDSGNPLVIPQDGPFTAQVIDAGDDWTWANAVLSGFASGSVVVGGTGGPVGAFDATNVAGFGQAQFTLEGTSTGADHPRVTISLPATASGGAVPTLSAWGLLSLTLAVLISGTLILDRRRATLPSSP